VHKRDQLIDVTATEIAACTGPQACASMLPATAGTTTWSLLENAAQYLETSSLCLSFRRCRCAVLIMSMPVYQLPSLPHEHLLAQQSGLLKISACLYPAMKSWSFVTCGTSS
jgi:hypothetical protein